MTIGLARRFGDRILIVADTMISWSSTKNEMIPGRVKAVVLTEDVSAAYAGSVEHALPALQKSAQVARHGGRLEEIIEPLRATSADTAHDKELETEFLVASHRGEIAMMKVWRGGQITKSDDLLWIGEPSVADAMARLEAEAPARAGQMRSDSIGPPRSSWVIPRGSCQEGSEGSSLRCWPRPSAILTRTWPAQRSATISLLARRPGISAAG
ncbi:hypothetical protein ACVOMS_11065 [Bradyrhizobium guangxiense]